MGGCFSLIRNSPSNFITDVGGARVRVGTRGDRVITEFWSEGPPHSSPPGYRVGELTRVLVTEGSLEGSRGFFGVREVGDPEISSKRQVGNGWTVRR